MTDTPAPLRAQTTSAARDAHLDRTIQVVPLHAAPAPTDPAAILAARQAKPSRMPKGKIMLYATIALVAAQLVAPTPMKPTVVAGQAAAGFYSQIMAASAVNQETVAHVTLLAQRLADLEARYSEARAKCFWGELLGPEAGELCAALVDQNFVPAIRQLRQQLGQ